MDARDLFFRPEPKQSSKTKRVWNIKETKNLLGPSVCKNILFVHALLGCDTTSSIYGIGKGVALHEIKTDALFREQADVFNRAVATKKEVVEAGEKALLCLYNNKPADESLNSLRYTRFCQKVATAKSFLQPGSLPPTSSAAAYHSQRVYFQIQQWEGVLLKPAEWGWKLSSGKLLPIKTELPPAHESPLEFVRCNCKKGCSTQKCTCRKNGLDCSPACGECKGYNCVNSAPPDLECDVE